MPFTRVRIVGPSMEPAVRNGDWWLVRRTTRVRAGDIVLMVHPRRPHAMVVKRVARPDPEGWWVLGDNPDHSEDSRDFGPVPAHLIVGHLTLRYFPVRRAARRASMTGPHADTPEPQQEP